MRFNIIWSTHRVMVLNGPSIRPTAQDAVLGHLSRFQFPQLPAISFTLLSNTSGVSFRWQAIFRLENYAAPDSGAIDPRHA